MVRKFKWATRCELARQPAADCAAAAGDEYARAGNKFCNRGHVRVPLGPRETFGVVWSVSAQGGGNLKPILSKTALPALAEPIRRFIQRVADYPPAPPGMVARMALRASLITIRT